MLLLSDNQYHKHDNHRSTPINEFLQLIVIIVDSIILVSQKSIKKNTKKRNLTKNYLMPYNIINQQFCVIGFFESFITQKSLKKILRLFCGVYEARTRDPMRDRHVF